VYGFVRVPKELAVSPNAAIVLELAANATSGVTVMQVLSKNVADGGSLNPGSLTAETQQNVTVPGTAYLRKQVVFALTNQPAGDDLLIVRVKHVGTDGSDTLAVNTEMWSCALRIDVLPS
jgi:FlaG/FlaF family flagellin (archaellin)